MAPTVIRLTHTATQIRRGIWVTAGLTMAGSALTGALTFDHLHEFWGIGLATAFAVDVALWVVLTGDHALQALGLDSGAWGRIMRVGTAGMSGLLNCGYSILMGQPYLAVLHAILPVLLVGLTEYHQGVALAISGAIESAEAKTRDAATVPSPVVVPAAPIATPPIGGLGENFRGVTVTSAPIADIGASVELQHDLHRGAEPTTQTPLRLVSPASASTVQPATPSRSALSASTPSAPTRPTRSSRSTPQPPTVAATTGRGHVRQDAIRWLVRQHRKGVDLTTITPQTLAAGIGGKVDTCRRSLDAWRTEALARCEATA